MTSTCGAIAAVAIAFLSIATGVKGRSSGACLFRSRRLHTSFIDGSSPEAGGGGFVAFSQVLPGLPYIYIVSGELCAILPAILDIHLFNAVNSF